MSHNVNSAGVVDKEKSRRLNSRQIVEAFLRKNGRANRGTVWHNQDDITGVRE